MKPCMVFCSFMLLIGCVGNNVRVEEDYRSRTPTDAVEHYTNGIENGTLKGQVLLSALIQRSRAYKALGKRKEARADLDRAIGLKPQASDAEWLYRNRAILNRDDKRYDDAMRDINEAIKLTEWPISALIVRGMLHHRAGRHEEALSDFDHALRVEHATNRTDYANSNRVKYGVYTGKAFAYAATGRAELASENLDNAVDVAHGNPESSNALAWLFATHPDPFFRDGPKAMKLALAATSMRRNAQTLDSLAAAYAESGNFEEAIKTQQMALAANNGQDTHRMGERLTAYKNKQPWRSTM